MYYTTNTISVKLLSLSEIELMLETVAPLCFSCTNFNVGSVALSYVLFSLVGFYGLNDNDNVKS
ncbi:hypothetical protein PIROE2DRAFT_10370 [Piromyces sp. E2]|nr:hypothetical protein PIROE2DRAFT_10370 [Piromyces sp. E2]|eukprot:OUM63154.1 hypothetical protein PIROE2DRAFT_10370 [Piromyces sp. E2]